MRTNLGRIAVIGLGVGVISLSLAHVLGGRDLGHLLASSLFTGQACKAAAGADKSPERRLAWNGDAIDIALPATVRFRGGEGSDIVVRGSPDTIANVEVRGSRLVLNCRWGGLGIRDVEVVLPGRALRRVGISGSAKVVMEKLDQPELALAISGSGSFAAQGTVDQLSVTVSGSGNARLAEIAARQLTVKISGSGNVEAAPKEEADITISGSGNVRLLSRPARLKTHVAGSGRITQLPAESAEGRKK